MTVVLAVASATGAFAATSTPVGFTDDMPAAIERSRSEGKPMVVDFSGSDWCGWCKRLDREVFSRSEFLDAVTNRYVLVFIDTPHDKSLLSETAKVENPKLLEKYDIHGFPTVLVFDAEGNVIGRTGYRNGGAAAYVKHLDSIVSAAPYLQEWVAPLNNKFMEILNGSGSTMSQLPQDATQLRIEVSEKAIADLKALREAEMAKTVPDGVKAAHDELMEEISEAIVNIGKYVESLKNPQPPKKGRRGRRRRPSAQ